jgi:very-short-patch-repair endonuclease
LGIQNDALFEKLAQCAINKSKEFNAQNIANTAWAFAVVNLLDVELCRKLFLFASLLDIHKYSDENLTQLSYVNVHIKFEKKGDFPKLPQTLVKTISSLPLQEPQSSLLHQDVSSRLTEMGLQFSNEVSINNLIVDICISEKRLVIEVDGPSHFAYRSHISLGHTLFKKRLLEAMKWNVLSIPYWQWDKLGDDIHAKIEYLKSAIKDKV